MGCSEGRGESRSPNRIVPVSGEWVTFSWEGVRSSYECELVWCPAALVLPEVVLVLLTRYVKGKAEVCYL